MNYWGLTVLINTITYCYLVRTKPTQPFLPLVPLSIFICTPSLFPFSTYSEQECLVGSRNFHSKDRKLLLGVCVHCMAMKSSNLGKTSVFKKPQTFMDEKDEDREVDKILQALAEILNLYWDVLFILCAEFIYVLMCVLFRDKWCLKKKL